jgi:hypothetical protein
MSYQDLSRIERELSRIPQTQNLPKGKRVQLYAKLLSGEVLPITLRDDEPILGIKARLQDPKFVKLFSSDYEPLEDTDLIRDVLSPGDTVLVLVDLDAPADDSPIRYRRALESKKREQELLQEKARVEREIRREMERRVDQERQQREHRYEEEKCQLEEDVEYRIQKQREREDLLISRRREQEDKEFLRIRDPEERYRVLSKQLSQRRWESLKLKAKRISEDIYRKSKSIFCGKKWSGARKSRSRRRWRQ